MSSEMQNVNGKTRRYVGAGPRYWRHAYLLRGIVCVIVGVAIIVNVEDAQWGHSVYAAPVSQAGTLAVVGSNGASLYAPNGAEPIAQLAPGTVLTAVGRTEDNLWVVVHNSASLSGWMRVSEAVLFGLEQLPVVLKNAQPSALPTAEVSAATSPSAQPSALVPTPTLAPTPSATPISTPLPSPTSSPISPPATGQASLVAIVSVEGAALYDRPGGLEIGQLVPGTALSAWGRTADGQWLAAVIASGASGWVPASSVVIGNVEELPILDPSGGLPSTANSESVEESATAVPPQITEEAAAAEVPVAASSTPSPSSDRLTATVDVTDSRLNIRGGPGTEFPVLGQANRGEQFDIIGRNAEATWININAPEVNPGIGWVSAEFIILSQPVSAIPVSEASNQSGPALPPSASPISASPIMATDIGCTTSQIAVWNEEQGTWVCSDELAALRAELTALQAEVASLRTEVATLRAEVSP